MSGDEGHAVHYTTVSRGTPIYGSDGAEVGRVVRVLDNHREHILDGIVFEEWRARRGSSTGPRCSGRSSGRLS